MINETMRKYMDEAQAKEPRAVIVAESMQEFMEWCHDKDLVPSQVRQGRHPDFICAFIAPVDVRQMTGLRRGLKWIEVGILPYDMKDYLTRIRLADWQ